MDDFLSFFAAKNFAIYSSVKSNSALFSQDNNRFDLSYEIDDASDEEMDVIQDEILGIVSKVPRKKPTSPTTGERVEPPSAGAPNEALLSPAKDEPEEAEEDDEWEEEEEEEKEELSLDGAITLDEADIEDLDEIKEEEQVPDEMDPVYSMPLGELLESAGVEPLAIEGSLNEIITGIQHDSR